MKKIILIATALLLSAVVYKTGKASDLNLRLHDYGNFYLVIDRQVIDNGGNSYSIADLHAGYHRLEVYRRASGRHNFHSVMIFSGSIFLPDNTIVYSMIGPRNNYVVLSETALFSEPYYGGNYYAPMSRPEFESLMESVRRTSFDSSRLKLAMTALSSNFVTALQVKSLMELLSFDSSRLELAKFAYDRTVDKNHYYIVNGALTFSSSIDELNDFILAR